MQFKFMAESLNMPHSKYSTFNANSLAGLMWHRPEDFLQDIRTGMKIVELRDMDNSTFDALIEYGKGTVNFENTRFKFMAEPIDAGYSKESTCNAYSLAILMWNNREEILQDIRANMKIVKDTELRDMDDSTFDALIEYGKAIVNLKDAEFKFMAESIDTVCLKERTLNAHALITLMDQPEDILQKIRTGMKIVELRDMDNSTFDALIEHGKVLSESRPRLRR